MKKKTNISNRRKSVLQNAIWFVSAHNQLCFFIYNFKQTEMLPKRLYFIYLFKELKIYQRSFYINFVSLSIIECIIKYLFAKDHIMGLPEIHQHIQFSCKYIFELLERVKLSHDIAADWFLYITIGMIYKRIRNFTYKMYNWIYTIQHSLPLWILFHHRRDAIVKYENILTYVR